jgi:hypothetical protein
MMNMKTQLEYQKRWLESRKREGWRHVQVFVPPPLADLLGKQIKDWKHNNSIYYKQPYK